jgi:hypothetical protein
MADELSVVINTTRSNGKPGWAVRYWHRVHGRSYVVTNRDLNIDTDASPAIALLAAKEFFATLGEEPGPLMPFREGWATVDVVASYATQRESQ